jgi:hypothetical protein
MNKVAVTNIKCSPDYQQHTNPSTHGNTLVREEEVASTESGRGGKGKKETSRKTVNRRNCLL